MNIIFKNANNWQLPFFKVLNFFGQNIFYLNVKEKSDDLKNKLALKLKKKTFTRYQ